MNTKKNTDPVALQDAAVAAAKKLRDVAPKTFPARRAFAFREADRLVKKYKLGGHLLETLVFEIEEGGT